MSSEQNEPSSAAPWCANNCGFYGNPANRNLCSKCYREAVKEDTASQPPCRVSQNDGLLPVSLGESQKLATPSFDNFSPSQENAENMDSRPLDVISQADVNSTDLKAEETPEEETSTEPPAQVNKSRCYKCNKKVGLFGFQCRCGWYYCGEHRYADAHECQFDYKTFERAQLKKHNERVIADKVNKI